MDSISKHPFIAALSISTAVLTIASLTSTSSSPPPASQPSPLNFLKNLLLSPRYLQISPALLNASPGNKSKWMNLGRWPAPSYAIACESLAIALADALNLQTSDTVLDVGCGRGDSMLLWTAKYDVKTVHGINVDPDEVAHAQSRGLSVHHGSGTDATLLSSPQYSGVTAVVALDCLYHFTPSRRAFFDAVVQHPNKPRLGFTDVVMKEGVKATLGVKMGARIAGVPACNVVTKTELFMNLADAGFKDISIKILSDDEVFGGFANFVRERKSEYKANLVDMGMTEEGVKTLLDKEFSHFDNSARFMDGFGKQTFSYVVVSASQ